jgi:hypothetical protein
MSETFKEERRWSLSSRRPSRARIPSFQRTPASAGLSDQGRRVHPPYPGAAGNQHVNDDGTNPVLKVLERKHSGPALGLGPQEAPTEARSRRGSSSIAPPAGATVKPSSPVVVADPPSPTQRAEPRNTARRRPLPLTLLEKERVLSAAARMRAQQAERMLAAQHLAERRRKAAHIARVVKEGNAKIAAARRGNLQAKGAAPRPVLTRQSDASPASAGAPRSRRELSYSEEDFEAEEPPHQPAEKSPRRPVRKSIRANAAQAQEEWQVRLHKHKQEHRERLAERRESTRKYMEEKRKKVRSRIVNTPIWDRDSPSFCYSFSSSQ